MIIELNRCDILCDVRFTVDKGEPGCSYKDGSFHQGIPDEIIIDDIKITEVHFDNSFINKKWLERHPDWHDWLVGIVEEIVTDYDNPYYKQLLLEN